MACQPGGPDERAGCVDDRLMGDQARPFGLPPGNQILSTPTKSDEICQISNTCPAPSQWMSRARPESMRRISSAMSAVSAGLVCVMWMG